MLRCSLFTNDTNGWRKYKIIKKKNAHLLESRICIPWGLFYQETTFYTLKYLLIEIMGQKCFTLLYFLKYLIGKIKQGKARLYVIILNSFYFVFFKYYKLIYVALFAYILILKTKALNHTLPLETRKNKMAASRSFQILSHIYF